MDTSLDNAFHVHLGPDHINQFVCMEPGLYVYDASLVDVPKLRNAFNLLNTVDQNKSLFRQPDIRKADVAIILNRRVNHVAAAKFIRIVKDNWIQNLPFPVGDVRRSNIIYGPPIPPLKGRTRYQAPKRVPDADAVVQLPKDLYEDLQNVTLCIDFHYVNGMTVFHSISRVLTYRTVSFPDSRSKKSILAELKPIFQVYNARGFRIIEIHADCEFQKN